VVDIGARKHKNHRIRISGLTNILRQNEYKSNFRSFRNPSILKEKIGKILLEIRGFVKVKLE
jgi:hypothetical protein